MAWLRALSTVGLLLGTLFFAFSLTPSLVPRDFVVQGVISGLSFVAGYSLGFAAHWVWDYLGLPNPTAWLDRIIKGIATAVCLLLVTGFLWQASEWQNRLRALMEMPPQDGLRVISIGLIALLIFLVFLLLARLFTLTFRFLSRHLEPWVPRRVSRLVGVTAALALFWAVIDGVVFSLALRTADNSFQRLDALIQDDLERPAVTERAGGPDSLMDWEELGSRGRRFVTGGPDAAAIADHRGEPAMEPIRVYSSLGATDTPEARAELALAELKRLDAFERSVLLLATPTGRGWIDPAAQDPVEYLFGGDIATVTAQYSYLPSPLSLIAEGEYGVATARALFKAVHDHWSRLPEDERPALYLHGLSLGALNSDRSFDFYDIIEAPFDGALWSGPPFRSETWRTVTTGRDPDSPAWLPVFRDGSVIRFANQERGLDAAPGDWGRFRIGILQYASDPVTFFDPQSFYSEPDWMQAPRGPDVSPDLQWFPVVTMLQLLADMAAGDAPRGYGHEYAAEDYIDAWVALTEPEGWSASDTRRLKARFRAADDD